MKVNIESANKFNDRLLVNKVRLQEIMSKVKAHPLIYYVYSNLHKLDEKQLQSRHNLDNTNTSFQSHNIPLYVFNERNQVLYDNNN